MGRSILKIHLQQGVLGDAAVILRGKLPALDAQREIALPRLEVLGVKRQEGDIAVQADPAFNVQARDLRDCQETELERVAAWLDPQFRAATRLALHYAGGAYAGKLRLAPRTPEVVCDTVTNVRITDRAIEETIFLNYSIRNAGIHELTFLLPASMADARISTPMLRRKTVAPVDPKAAGSPLRVRLELQGDVMNDLRVLVENDRLLTPGSHDGPAARLRGGCRPRRPTSCGTSTSCWKPRNRDELVVEPPVGLEALSRQQQQWQTLSELLGTKRLYQAYLVQPGAAQPRLSFHLQRHEDVETAGARIDLAQTTIVVDANGAYRAKVELSLDNSSEQFLDVELPEGADAVDRPRRRRAGQAGPGARRRGCPPRAAAGAEDGQGRSELPRGLEVRRQDASAFGHVCGAVPLGPQREIVSAGRPTSASSRARWRFTSPSRTNGSTSAEPCIRPRTRPT